MQRALRLHRTTNPMIIRRSKRLASSSRRWSDLPPNLLCNISSHLHVAADYVRFHAVCTRWRDTLPPVPSRPVLLPWLLGPRDGSGRRIARCVFSSSKPSICCRRRRNMTTNAGLWVQDRKCVIRTDDGTVASIIPTTTTTTCLESSSSSSFPDVFAGSAITPMPCWPDDVKVDHVAGGVSGDGTIFLYTIGEVFLKYYLPTFNASLLHPGDVGWTPVRSGHVHVGRHERARCSVAYNGGKILLCKDNFCGCIVTDDETRVRDVLEIWDPQEPGMAIASSYAIESHGELLRASVDARKSECYCYDGDGRKRKRTAVEETVSVSVHALQEVDEVGGGKRLRWVESVEQSLGLAGRVLFLGQPVSFAVDAALLGMGDGGGAGCAYFVHGEKRRCVYKYNFGDEKLELVAKLPEEWSNVQAFSWVTPQPCQSVSPFLKSQLKNHRQQKQQCISPRYDITNPITNKAWTKMYPIQPQQYCCSRAAQSCCKLSGRIAARPPRCSGRPVKAWERDDSR